MRQMEEDIEKLRKEKKDLGSAVEEKDLRF